MTAFVGLADRAHWLTLVTLLQLHPCAQNAEKRLASEGATNIRQTMQKRHCAFQNLAPLHYLQVR